MKTKGGKSMNPTDAYRKELRKKELKRNKKERKKVRDVGILKKDPEAIKDQIRKLDTLNTEADGALDKTKRHKKRQLEDTLNLVLKKRKEYAEKMKEKGEDPIMFSHLPAPRANAPGEEEERAGLPEDSVYYHPTLNPSGHAPSGKQPMYKPFTAAEAGVSVPLPPPPPPPPLPTTSSDDKLNPLSVPVPPPPPAPPRLPQKPSSLLPIPPPPPPPPPPIQATGESSTSGGRDDEKAELLDAEPLSRGATDEEDGDDSDQEETTPSTATIRVPIVPSVQTIPGEPQRIPVLPPSSIIRPGPPPAPRLPLPPPTMVASVPQFTFPVLPHAGMAYGVPPAFPPQRASVQQEAPKANKPFYVKSAAPTATKRPLAQHTPGLTAMVPASVRVKREAAPKLKPRSTVSSGATGAGATSSPAGKPPPVLPVKPQSIDESYSAFLEDMKALGAFDEEDTN